MAPGVSDISLEPSFVTSGKVYEQAVVIAVCVRLEIEDRIEVFVDSISKQIDRCCISSDYVARCIEDVVRVAGARRTQVSVHRALKVQRATPYVRNVQRRIARKLVLNSEIGLLRIGITPV